MLDPSSGQSNGVQAGFFAELRRRRVLRTPALYIVAAWVLIQKLITDGWLSAASLERLP